ncbi:MAG: methionyl-tRNA formyltransferase [Clostridia bacterium]|nr:methionyl-tRNA formyltransferase [Clostridia bacterium]
MRVVFMGTPDFAVPTLERLAEKHDVIGVFTQPDKPKGRHMTMTPSDVKVKAEELNIPVFQLESLKHGEAMPILEELKPDVIVVAAYGQILKEDVLNFPKYGCINAHGSILPKYRGAAPIQRAVIDGETETGVTAMLMNEGLDTGDILKINRTQIDPDETAGELFDRLAKLAADTIEETLDNIDELTANRMKQPEEGIYAKMLSKADCPIDWNKTAQEIHNQIRGLNPWPTATTKYKDETIKIHKSQLTDTKSIKPAGTITAEKDRLFVATGDRELEILEIQPQNKNRMAVKDYLLGHTLEGVFE